MLYSDAKAEPPFDLAFAVQVGAMDGRHAKTGRIAPDLLRQVHARMIQSCPAPC